MINGQSMTTGTQETLYLREVAAGRTTSEKGYLKHFYTTELASLELI